MKWMINWKLQYLITVVRIIYFLKILKLLLKTMIFLKGTPTIFLPRGTTGTKTLMAHQTILSPMAQPQRPSVYKQPPSRTLTLFDPSSLLSCRDKAGGGRHHSITHSAPPSVLSSLYWIRKTASVAAFTSPEQICIHVQQLVKINSEHQVVKVLICLMR